MKASVVALLLVAVAGSPAWAEWDRKMRSDNGDGDGCGSTRFTCVLGRQAVRDNETGLVWERAPDLDEQTWFNAVRSCWQLEISDRMGWHLPTIEQLASLLDPSEPSGLPQSHPFLSVATANANYWSITTDSRPDTERQAWLILLSTKSTGDAAKTSSALRWCVRGGNVLDPTVVQP